jgi:hypothetical protein
MLITEPPRERPGKGVWMGGKRRVALQRCPRCGCTLERPLASPQGGGLCPSCLLSDARIEAGEYFRASRLAAGLSVEELADRSGIDVARIECYEDGQLSPGWRETSLLFWVLGPLLPRPSSQQRRAT